MAPSFYFSIFFFFFGLQLKNLLVISRRKKEHKMKSSIISALYLSVLINISFSATQLNGAGASFPYPIYSNWFLKYQQSHKDVRFNYRPIGSGGGIRQLIAGTVDFGASDVPLKPKSARN